MSYELNASATRAGALRHTFDQAFALPPAALEEDAENLLAIRIAGEPYAMLLHQTHGLFTNRKIVPLPGRAAAFIGIACLRSGIVAVHNLRTLLGYAAADVPMRWLVSVGEGARACALAVEQFDAYARISRAEFSQAGRSGHIQATAIIAGERRSILALDSILNAIAATS